MADDGPDAGHDPLSRLRCRDEVLQVLYWLAGEGFEGDMTAAGVARFLARPEQELGPAFEDAIDAGLVARVAGTGRYELTAAGRREGGRRFAEEFAEMFARDAHGGTCSDPSCDCHDSPEAAVGCRSHAHGGRAAP